MPTNSLTPLRNIHGLTWRSTALGLLLAALAMPALVHVHRAAAVPNTWSPAGSLATARSEHTATLLPNGKVLASGGFNSGGVLASAELYDPIANTWSPAASMTTARRFHTATLLPARCSSLAELEPASCWPAPNSTTRSQTPGRRRPA